ncbi:MAG: hypothetical protein LAO76_26920 [Acidobacteriia bacterium]|nr:hypothetical protein [Terriglobia bacterium]
MSNDRRDPRTELDAILEALVDSIETATDEEVIEESQASGENLKAVAQEVKTSLLAGIKRFEQRKLNAARQTYKSRTGAQRKQFVFSPTPEGRRSQFLAILASKPQMQAMLTVQHRDFESLTDDDIQSALEELGELGVFDNEGKQSE